MFKKINTLSKKSISRVRVLAKEAKGHFIKPKRSFSQKGEDLIAKTFFQHIGIKKGIYCDVGAFHPKWISNTHLFHKAGWSGFAVDIDNAKLMAFKRARKQQVKCMRYAISGDKTQNREIKYFTFGVYSDQDTISRSVAESIKEKTGNPYREELVPQLNINDLLDKTGKINFLNIDIEGVDTETIASLNLNRHRPELIIFEDNEHWGGTDILSDKFRQAGYTRLFISGSSVGYAALQTH